MTWGNYPSIQRCWRAGYYVRGELLEQDKGKKECETGYDLHTTRDMSYVRITTLFLYEGGVPPVGTLYDFGEGGLRLREEKAPFGLLCF